jgi:uncharacterized protein YcbX
MPTLGRVCVTPIKGTRLLHPGTVVLGPGGVVGNRCFYLVDGSGALRSGGDHGPLVRVEAEYAPAGDRLTVRYPDGTAVEGDARGTGPLEQTDFYGRGVRGREVPGAFSEAFSSYVGRALRLLRADVDGDASDAGPLTLLSRASVDDLAARGGHEGELDPLRFRVNLELEGCEPYEEDGWVGRRIAIGEAVVRITGQIPRCLVTNQDPRTGEKDWDTLRQIAEQRPRIGGTGGLPFGVYAHVETPGRIAAGDRVAPLAQSARANDNEF